MAEQSLLLLLLLIGLALIFNNQIKIILLNKQVKHTQSAPLIVVMWKKHGSGSDLDFDAVEPASSEAVLRAQLSNKALPVIGGVAVPSVGINLPIFKGLANEALLYGAGTLSPTQKWGRQLRVS